MIKSYLKRVLKAGFRLLKMVVKKYPLLKRISKGILNRYPVIGSVVARLGGVSVERYLASSFEDLKSIRIMKALSDLPSTNQGDSVIFLKVLDDRA